MKMLLVVSDVLGSEDLRIDTGTRVKTSTSMKEDRVIAFTDLSSAQTRLLWAANDTIIPSPVLMVFITDPDNAYADNLATPPTITLSLVTADDTAGTNPVSTNFDVPREQPWVFSGVLRTAISTATTGGRVPFQLYGRSNMASGYGTVKGRMYIR